MVRNVLGYPKNDLLQHLVDSNWVGEKSGKLVKLLNKT